MEYTEKQIDELLKIYNELFGTNPPADIVVGYYTQLYARLLVEAIDKEEPITADQLDNAIGNQPYDVVIEQEEKPSKRPQDLIELSDEE